jgi:hypothetical protein
VEEIQVILAGQKEKARPVVTVSTMMVMGQSIVPTLIAAEANPASNFLKR